MEEQESIYSFRLQLRAPDIEGSASHREDSDDVLVAGVDRTHFAAWDSLGHCFCLAAQKLSTSDALSVPAKYSSTSLTSAVCCAAAEEISKEVRACRLFHFQLASLCRWLTAG